MEFEVLDENYVIVDGTISLHTSLIVSMGENGFIMIGTLKQIYEDSQSKINVHFSKVKIRGLAENSNFLDVFKFLSKIFLGTNYPIITSEEMNILFETLIPK